MKKLLLSLGTVATVVAPVTAVVACGDKKETAKATPTATPTATPAEIEAIIKNWETNTGMTGNIDAKKLLDPTNFIYSLTRADIISAELAKSWGQLSDLNDIVGKGKKIKGALMGNLSALKPALIKIYTDKKALESVAKFNEFVLELTSSKDNFKNLKDLLDSTTLSEADKKALQDTINKEVGVTNTIYK